MAALTLLAASLLIVLCTPTQSGDDEANIVVDDVDPSAAATDSTAAPTGTAEGSAAAPTAPLASPTPIPATPTATVEPIREIAMSFSGDVLSHGAVYSRARALGSADWEYDYRPMFAEVTDRLAAADLALCVLETPVSPDNTGLAGYPVFNAPAELPAALAEVGFDGCATASNHSFDQGVAGITATLDQMDLAGLGHAGMARTAAEQQSIRSYTIGEVIVAHLSWTYSLNGYILPDGQEWLVNVTDADLIVEQAAQARAAGADIVLLSIQWGNEYVTEPTANQLELAQALTAPGDIDVIVGNHAHVVQPIDVVNGTPVIYGLGNFLSNQSSECCPARTQDGVIVEVTFAGSPEVGWEVEKLTALPTWVDRSTYTIVPLAEALAADDLTSATRSLYETSYERTMGTLTSLNADVQPAE